MIQRYCAFSISLRAVGFGITGTLFLSHWAILSGSSSRVLQEALRFAFELYYTGFMGSIIMFAISFLAATLPTNNVREITHLTI